MPKVTWSYSNIKLFQQCPHKYYRLRVKKDVHEEPSDALRYGNYVHKAAEMYIKQGKPLPDDLEFIQGALDRLNAMEGTKHCELRLGLTQRLEPCGFFGKGVWWRGIIDLLILNGDEARVVDYKTGKNANFAEKDQLELMALAVFRHYPEVTRVRAGLLYFISAELVKDEYNREDSAPLWAPWINNVMKLETAVECDAWPKYPNFTCAGWCPVKDCEHWSPRRK